MNPAAILKERIEANFTRRSASNYQNGPDRPAILIATADLEIQKGLAELLRDFLINTIWVSGVEEAKRVLGKERVAACLCGFWLQDGTYRELIRHMRREKINVSVIIVSAPFCPNEYWDYLAAMNIGALDFLCYPYRPFDFERMLESAIATSSDWTGQQLIGSGRDLRERGAA